MSVHRRAPDQEQRDAAVRARGQNVMIDAGAGTGKTSTIVSRLLGMIAPDDGSEPMPIERIAAITFTRRAAGELRLRIRERILAKLAEEPPGGSRADALRNGLAGLDTAAIGTIHSFADRLLRQRPVETKLSPEYEIHEDDDLLAAEAVGLLLGSAQAGTLRSEVGDGLVEDDLVIEAEATIAHALEAGLAMKNREHERGVKYGIEGLLEGFLRNRDVPPDPPAAEPFDRRAFESAVAELRRLADGLDVPAPGVGWLKRVAGVAERATALRNPARIFRVVRELAKSPRSKSKKEGFANDAAAWNAWKAFDGDERVNPVRDRPLRDDVLDPLRRWLAVRLVRLFPVAVAVYERVKARHRAVDQMDLLLKLRDLLRENLEARAHFQLLFDHVFVDEFQDTDPLQAEIVLYLCEDGARAGSWNEVRLAAGKLTIVGDAKQSIYRFRRADVAMYDEVRKQIAASDHLACTLSANFRSLPSLIEWVNDRFPEVLGTSPEAGKLFDVESGRVYYQPLLAGRNAGDASAAAAPVHIVGYGLPAGAKADAPTCRDTEGVALARYIRSVVGNLAVQIADPATGQRRPVTYGDVAVLALSTYDLHRLFEQLDGEGIPHAMRGGTLFLRDELHRRFLLALRAIADRDDGPAQAALLRPPFFAVDPLDLLLERESRRQSDEGVGPPASDPRVQRAAEALAIVRDIRARRFARPPGETARDVIERTALGRWVARQPNGAQRLRHLYEICAVLEQNAAAEGLDYDRATVRLRDWVEHPVQLDPPLPVGSDAVQALTVHQAKGLEFPVVVLWDGRAGTGSIDPRPAWRVSRDGRTWSIGLDGLEYEHPAGAAIADRERKYRNEERRRLVYVAATRARDVLVLPRAPGLTAQHIHKWFEKAVAGCVQEVPAYRADAEPEWARSSGALRLRSASAASGLEPAIGERWATAHAAASQPCLRAIAVTNAARDDGALRAGTPEETPNVVLASTDAAEAEAPSDRPERTGRFGPRFGTVVHRAIPIAFRSPGEPIRPIVQRVASRVGLTEHLEEAEADVARALEVLLRLGIAESAATKVRFEYPICGEGSDGSLVGGFIDLVATTPTEIHVIDFKTDAAPGASGPPEHYARQLGIYQDLLAQSGASRERRVISGLLYTIDGSLRQRFA